LRRFVETLKSDPMLLQNLSNSKAEVYPLPIRHHGGLSNVLVDRTWLLGHVKTFEGLNTLDSTVSEECLCKDMDRSLQTASTVVLLLWSSLELTWNLKLEDNFEDLVISVLFYIPMCGWDQKFIPFLKYQLSWLFARAEMQKEMPIYSGMGHNNGIVLLGWLGRFFKSRLFGSKLKNMEWRNTVLHGIKKGLPKMDSFYLQKNKEAMIKRLCPTEPKVTPDCLLDEIQRTAREIFPRGILYEDWEHVDRFTEISDHCSYEMNRSKRGNVGQLFKDSDYIHYKGLNGLNVCIESTVLGSMYYNPQKNLVGEIRFPGWDLVTEYRNRRVVAFNSTEPGKALVKPIFEPLKIRMITAGDINTNGLYSRLQKLLWSGLQKFSPFSLTGKTVVAGDLESLYYRSVSYDKTFKYWVSGDYSAATDNLNRDASLAAIEAISGDPITFLVLKKGLMDTLLDFSSCGLDDLEDDEPLREMKNGQLMGCVFSFPILCIINLACYRMALESYEGIRYDISDLPVKVNGDDIMFLGNKKLISIWEETIKGAGFEKSVGKNYVSKSFAIINSTYFNTFNPEHIHKIPYVNMGWVSGERKCGIESLDGRISDAEDVWAIKDQVKNFKILYEQNPEYPCEQKDRDRRERTIEKFKDQVISWRFDSISKTGYSMIESPFGLDLKSIGDLDELSYETHEFFSTLYQELNLTKSPSFGLPSHPRTLVPWKVAGIKVDDSQFDFGKALELRVLRSKYFGIVRDLPDRKIKKFHESLMRKIQEREYRRFFSDIKSQYITLGELLH